MLNSKKINIGISIGDPNGIGIEIILKTLSDSNLFKECNFIVYSSEDLLKKQQDFFKIKTAPIKKIHSVNEANDDFINIKEVFTDSEFEFGKNDKDVSAMGIISFKEAVKDAVHKKIDILITSPINKNLSYSSSFKYSGHTDYLKKTLKKDPMMLMVSDNLKLGLFTEHIPIKDVVKELTVTRVVKKIKMLRQTLINDFLINEPRIAVLAINPHAGDNGVIGSEDQEILLPGIKKSKGLIFGPFSADTFFCNENFKKYDGVMAAYHDQGLIPFKTMSFGKGVNYSAGLSIIRTSPDHGTGFDIAGKGIASSTSFLQAIKIGINIYKSRNTIV
ncbi:MAG: 4-hydroxythreonine-4-phosphate dehydrogenase PdxA [Flavobacteriales bacterium]|nr:4-hydroxythreonine-4-phosphate dehydrogenase PdxA [Flavobacteriales bacterium]